MMLSHRFKGRGYSASLSYQLRVPLYRFLNPLRRDADVSLCDARIHITFNLIMIAVYI